MGRTIGSVSDPENLGERTSGLRIETCYRHPDVVTGVHCTRCGQPICPDCMTPAPVGYQCPECVKKAAGPVYRRRVRLVLGRPGSLTTSLLVLNIGMFLVELVVGGPGSLSGGPSEVKLFSLGALYPPAIAQGHQYWRLFTAMFLHAGILHIAFNMYALYLFGYLIESAFGWRWFLGIYFVSGFLASVTSFGFGPAIEVGVGASGAIFGLLGAWVAFNYRRRTNALASANLRWALMLIAINTLLAVGFRAIDWRAHVGGLVAGAIAGWLAEGVGLGSESTRRFAGAFGLVALALLGVAVVAWRVSTFPHIPGAWPVSF
jgi:membrane associated rhomboid family serine protease